MDREDVRGMYARASEQAMMELDGRRMVDMCARAADEAPSARYTPEVSRKVRLAGISSASRRVLPHQHYTTINTYRRHGRGRERVTAMVRSRSRSHDDVLVVGRRWDSLVGRRRARALVPLGSISVIDEGTALSFTRLLGLEVHGALVATRLVGLTSLIARRQVACCQHGNCMEGRLGVRTE